MSREADFCYHREAISMNQSKKVLLALAGVEKKGSVRSRWIAAFGILVLSIPLQSGAQVFDPAELDTFPTSGAFKVTLLDRSQVTFAGTDPATVVGRSDPFIEAVEPPAGVPIFNGGAAPYPDTA